MTAGLVTIQMLLEPGVFDGSFVLNDIELIEK